MIRFSRRALLSALSALGLLSSAACRRVPALEQGRTSSVVEKKPQHFFAHGIASGDPAPGRMIIWTRLSASAPEPNPRLVWQVSERADFSQISQSGEVRTDQSRDFTVKVDVDGLEAGKIYNYRFIYNEAHFSPIGQFKTLPEGRLEDLSLALVSCANYQTGFFNIYDHIARSGPYDAVIHLGDYLYEYGPEGWGGTFDRDRLHQPAHEIITLDDYRMRHAQYRADPDLQAMTRLNPLIAIWDDHEVADDGYRDGAHNHQSESEGEFQTRKRAALKAYYEWMPVREPQNAPLEARYSRYDFGDLVTLVTAETRLSSRSKPIDIDEFTGDFNGEEDVESFRENVLWAPDRHLLGAEQQDYIVSNLAEAKHSGQIWQILANQVLMSRVLSPDLTPHVDEQAIAALEQDWDGVRDYVESSKYSLPIYPDSWGGYPWAREQLYTALREAGLSDLLVVTGDAHEFWACDLTTKQGDPVGLELCTSAISSPTLESYFGDVTSDYALLMTQSNDDVRYYNPLYRGYIALKLGRSSGKATMIAVDNVQTRDYKPFVAAEFALRKMGGEGLNQRLRARNPKGLSLMQRVLFSGLG